eukprot:15365400-Ditylum_brightwellii.AAC.2
MANIAKKKGFNGSTKFCLVYGYCSHMTNKCNIMANTAKHHKGNNSTWTGCKSGRFWKAYGKQELNTIVCKSIKAALKKA